MYPAFFALTLTNGMAPLMNNIATDADTGANTGAGTNTEPMLIDSSVADWDDSDTEAGAQVKKDTQAKEEETAEEEKDNTQKALNTASEAGFERATNTGVDKDLTLGLNAPWPGADNNEPAFGPGVARRTREHSGSQGAVLQTLHDFERSHWIVQEASPITLFRKTSKMT